MPRSSSPSPLFRCVDMEGGTVDRLRDTIAPVPSVADIAAAGSSKLARRHGRLIGEEVRALGFNTAFAPVLDLRLCSVAGSVLTSRTVSDDPKKTTVYAREFLRGLTTSAWLGSGKHFPGLGEANLDSHAELRSSTRSGRRCGSRTCFRTASCASDLPFVMVAHAAYPEVTGDKTPASLSKKWMREHPAQEDRLRGWSSQTILTWVACWPQRRSKSGGRNAARRG